MEKVKIVKIAHFEKDSKGNAYINSLNKPYTRCLIQAADGRKLSGFGSETTRSWKVGEEVSLEITQNGQYWNFKTAPKAITREEFNSLSFDLKKLEVRIEDLERKVVGEKSVDEMADEVFGNEPHVTEEQ